MISHEAGGNDVFDENGVFMPQHDGDCSVDCQGIVNKSCVFGLISMIPVPVKEDLGFARACKLNNKGLKNQDIQAEHISKVFKRLGTKFGIPELDECWKIWTGLLCNNSKTHLWHQS
jgi:hypothetical protein